MKTALAIFILSLCSLVFGLSTGYRWGYHSGYEIARADNVLDVKTYHDCQEAREREATNQ